MAMATAMLRYSILCYVMLWYDIARRWTSPGHSAGRCCLCFVSAERDSQLEKKRKEKKKIPDQTWSDNSDNRDSWLLAAVVPRAAKPELLRCRLHCVCGSTLAGVSADKPAAIRATDKPGCACTCSTCSSTCSSSTCTPWHSKKKAVLSCSDASFSSLHAGRWRRHGLELAGLQLIWFNVCIA